MDGGLRYEIDRAAEHLSQAILEIEEVEAESSPRCKLVQKINVAVGRSLTSGHRPEHSELGDTETPAEPRQARFVDHSSIQIEDPGNGHGPIVTPTAPNSQQHVENTRSP